MSTQDTQERLRAALTAARDIAAAAEQAGRDFTAEERENITNAMTEAKDLKAQLQSAQADDALRNEIAEMGASIGTPSGGSAQAPVAGRAKARVATIGEQFASSDAYLKWWRMVAPGGQLPESAKGIHSPPVEFKTLITGESDTSAGAFVAAENSGIYEMLGRRPLVLRDLISMRTTESDLVEYVRQTVQVAQAAVVAEANVTDYTGATGQVSGKKPEAVMAFERVSAPVRTLAVWIPATKRALSDAGQLRGLIDAELRADLEEALEDEIIGGDGTGEHFTGIEHTDGVLWQDWDTDILTTARRAVTSLRLTSHTRPTAWLVHPSDAETIDLLQDAEDRYYYGGPAEGGVQRLWRYPVVESEAVTEGVGILGDWRRAVLWDRQRASIQISDSHSDFFVRNIVAILAEMRAAFGITRPSAFIRADFTAGS